MSEEPTVPRRTGGLPILSIVVEDVDGAACFQGSQERITVGSAAGNDVVLEDPAVSRYHLVLERAVDRVLVHDLGSTNGTTIGQVMVQGGTVRVTPPVVLDLGGRRIRVRDGEILMLETHGDDNLLGLRGRSAVMRRVMASVRRAAMRDASVLIVGESGTGKELIAHALHALSARAAGPFVTVDCASIPPTLFAAELFGAERGAFTGADRRRIGALEQARGGTVFLDEIGELSGELQAALLGALERRRMRRLGSEEEIDIDVRFVSATNRDLRREVNSGGFRLDLYYRLAVVLIEVPALRDHPEDIPILVEHFLREAGEGSALELFPPEALAELARHAFPGNVRELRNVVESALALGTHATRPPPPPDAVAGARVEQLLTLDYKQARRALLDDFERRYLEELMKRYQGNVRRAAQAAKMDRSYLTELLFRHKLR